MQITREWIHQNKTPKGGFNRGQIEALGLSWPLKSGWIDKLNGRVITLEQQKRFEDARVNGTPKKNAQKVKVKKKLSTGLKLTTDQQRLVKLDEIVMGGHNEEDREKATSLIMFFMKRQSWTDKQKWLIDSFIKKYGDEFFKEAFSLATNDLNDLNDLEEAELEVLAEARKYI